MMMLFIFADAFLSFSALMPLLFFFCFHFAAAAIFAISYFRHDDADADC